MTCKVVALFCYTSLDISNWLLEKKTTIVGTINSNWKGVSALKTYNDRVNQNTKVFFGKKVQWTHHELWTQSHQKNAMCCCFQPPIGAVTKEHGKQKLAIIRFYDYTQGETDIRKWQTTTSNQNLKMNHCCLFLHLWCCTYQCHNSVKT